MLMSPCVPITTDYLFVPITTGYLHKKKQIESFYTININVKIKIKYDLADVEHKTEISYAEDLKMIY